MPDDRVDTRLSEKAPAQRLGIAQRIGEPTNHRRTLRAIGLGLEALTALLSRYIKTPETLFPGSSADPFNATAHSAFGACHWRDADNNQVAWVHIRIRSLDEIQDYHRNNLLDEQYPIQSISDSSMWVWAGHFLITYVADDPSLQGQDNIRKKIHEFMDLKGLASIQAQANNTTANVDQ